MNVILLSMRSNTRLLLEYGAYLAVIVVSAILIAAIKRKTKSELRPEWVKSRCEKAKKYAQGLLPRTENMGAHLFLGTTQLLKLKNHLENAAWSAYQIVEMKKDIVFEGVASALDSQANALYKKAENGYVPVKEYEELVTSVIAAIDEVMKKIDAIAATR